MAVEAALREQLARHTAGAPPAVAEAMAYSLFAPGKRLRPLLVMLACEAVGGSIDDALAAGVAVEMVHTYSLVHDDLPAMDDDDLRRGLPTCHVKFGEALAILAGDALLTLAFEVLAASYGPKTAAVSCLELSRGAGVVGMVGGQVLDLEAEGRIAVAPPKDGAATSEDRVAGLENIHRRKTGALFRTALRLGVHAAQGERASGADTCALAHVDRYAAAFGLAFQVTDDLLDVESSADKVGKRVGKDAARGKLTYPGLLGADASRRKAQELGQEAVTAAGALGAGGEPLAELARYVVGRDR
ncbi:polyprenyl synthetase family protein [Fimbriiglobus ruber]|nr:farnesyl diphosphate synthase [Fimbriiglobus ruber]